MVRNRQKIFIFEVHDVLNTSSLLPTGSSHDGCREGSVRLVNSTIEYEGRVEVCSDGIWGTVCGVGILDATALCRVAGYAGGIIFKILEVAFLLL